MKISQPKHIIISRTDSIGDVALTLPLAGILKHKFPDVKITFLGNTYTKPIIQCCEYVDEIYEWSKVSQNTEKEQLDWLKSLKADVIIHVFPRKEIAELAKKSKIKYRIGTSHRSFHWLTCNVKVNFTRKRSELHESQLNTKLLAPLGINQMFSLSELTNFAGFNRLPKLPEKFHSLLSPQKTHLIFHAKSQGSALEWGVNKFVELAEELNENKYQIYFTGTEKESVFFRDLLPKKFNVIDLSGQMSLDELIAFIKSSDALIAASTGPLHIAGLCQIQTIGLFTPQKPLHPGRWRPLGKNVKIIVEKEISERTQPLNISLREVKKTIEDLF